MAGIKAKAKLKNGVVSIKALIKNPSMTYDQAKKKTGSRDNADFVTHLSATLNGETVADFSTSQFLSKNPIFKFEFKGIGAKGEKIELIAINNHGKTYKGKAKIK